MKRNKGITLVALVITIIILLLLSAISINSLFGENGIINKAIKAKIETKRAEYREELQKIVVSAKEYDKIQIKCEENKLFKGSKYVKYENDEIIMVKTQDNFEFMIRDFEVTSTTNINIEEGSVTIYPDYYIQNEEKIKHYNKEFLITGTTNENTVTIAGDSKNTYKIYMYNLSIKVASLNETGAFQISEGANVEIELINENVLSSGTSYAGLQKSSIDGTLILDGEGSLTATGGEYAAGIGGGDIPEYSSCTNIIINGGTINAKSGNLGPGIGAGYNNNAFVDNIIINGGIVNSDGNNAGIGLGRKGKSCSNIIINGGKVSSYSWYESTGIGGANLDNVKITGGLVNIYTTIGSTYPAIGIKGTESSEVGNIILSGGNVKLESKGSILIGTPTQEIPPIDEKGNEVVCTTIKLDGVNSEMLISELKLNNYIGRYGIKDLYTTATGEVYLWLPKNAEVVSISIEDKVYLAEQNIVAGESGILLNNMEN